MRKIKFRGKTVNGNEWIYGMTISKGTIKRKANKVFMEVEENRWKGLQDGSLGQYTGLKDKNGKEIYEGDVLHIKEYENLLLGMRPSEEEYTLFTINECMGRVINEYEAIVCYDDGCMMLKCKGKSYDMYISVLFGDMRRSSPIFEFEIIGNIHDNPELIKEEEKCEK